MTPEISSLITPARVMDLHREAATRYKGDPTQRRDDIDCVDGRIGAAGNAVSYILEDDEDWGLILASHVLFYLAKDHCFVDGNKRIAWLTAIEILKNLQLTVNATEEEAYGFMLDLADGISIRSAADVAVWLAERLEAAPNGQQVN